MVRHCWRVGGRRKVEGGAREREYLGYKPYGLAKEPRFTGARVPLKGLSRGVIGEIHVLETLGKKQDITRLSGWGV